MSSVAASTILSSAVTLTLASASRDAGSTLSEAVFTMPAGVFDPRWTQWRVSCDQVMVSPAVPAAPIWLSFSISGPTSEVPTAMSASGAIIASANIAVDQGLFLVQTSQATIPNMNGRQLRIRVLDPSDSADPVDVAVFAAVNNPWTLRLSFAPVMHTTTF